MEMMDLEDRNTTYPDDDYRDLDYSSNFSYFEGEWMYTASRKYNIYIMNVPLKCAIPLFGYLMPFLLFITIIANTLMVVVLAQRHMRTPTNMLLLAIAISDILTLLFPSPWYFYMYTLNNHSKTLYPAAACYAYQKMTETVPALFHTASMWLTLLLGVQRYIYMSHPTTARNNSTLPKIWSAMAGVFFFALVYKFPQFFDLTFETIQFRWRGGVHLGCAVDNADWVTNYISNTNLQYYPTYIGFQVLFLHLLPWLALTIFNLLLCPALRKDQLKLGELLKGTCH